MVKKRQCLERIFKTIDIRERLCYNNIQVLLREFLSGLSGRRIFMAAEINYMTELKAMYGYFLTKSPGKAAVAMLQALYMIDNAEHWAEWFEVDGDCLSRLMGGYSPEAIHQAREKLCHMGRIEYRQGYRNLRKASYRIIPFAKTEGKYRKYNTENIALSVETGAADNADLFVGDDLIVPEIEQKVEQKVEQNSKASYLYNKTKQNKTARARDPKNLSSGNPFFDVLELRGFDI